MLTNIKFVQKLNKIIWRRLYSCALTHPVSPQVLRPGVLSFLRDPADPNYNPFRDLVEEPLHRHLRRVALSLLIYGVLVVLLVFIPIRLALACRPALFPLNLRFSDPFTEVPADMLLFHICIPFTVEHFKPRATVKWLLAGWFKVVGGVLGLAEFLLPAPGEGERNGNGDENGNGNGNGNGNRNGNGFPAEEMQLAAQMANLEIHELDGTPHQPQNADAPPQTEDSDGLFPLRIVVLIFLGWLTLLGFNSLAVLVPVSVGRSVFGQVAKIPIASAVANCNDIYTFGAGCYILWGGGAAARYLVGYLQTHDLVSVAVQASDCYTKIWSDSRAGLLGAG
jgi:E3 ubiquitin-protein ligase MARCH6